MITGLAHVCIRTRDLDASAHFYGEVLGLERHFTFTRDGRPIGFYLKLSERNFLEFFVAEDRQPNASHLAHFCLETDDIEGLRRRVVDAGIGATEVKVGCDGSPQFWVEDPDGVAIEFHQYTPESAQLVPRDIEVDW